MTTLNQERSARRSHARVFVTTVVAIAAAVTLGLIAFALFTDFPGEPHGAADMAGAHPEEVVRSLRDLLNE